MIEHLTIPIYTTETVVRAWAESKGLSFHSIDQRIKAYRLYNELVAIKN